MNPFVLSPNKIKYNPGLFNPAPSASPSSGSKIKSESDIQLSLINEPTSNYVEYEHYLSISSSSRNFSSYPLHYDYRINFNTTYKNIKKVELVSSILPNKAASSSGASILNEPFLIIDIEQLNFINFPINNSTNSFKGFSILPLKSPTQTVGGFINPELGCMYHTARIFKTPLASLSNMTIKIRNSNGILYDFGSPNGSAATEFQNHLVFKITCEEADIKVLNHRNIF